MDSPWRKPATRIPGMRWSTVEEPSSAKRTAVGWRSGASLCCSARSSCSVSSALKRCRLKATSAPNISSGGRRTASRSLSLNPEISGSHNMEELSRVRSRKTATYLRFRLVEKRRRPSRRTGGIEVRMIEGGQSGHLRRDELDIELLRQRFSLGAFRGIGGYDGKQDAASVDRERAHQLFCSADAVGERCRIDFWILRDGIRSRITALAQVIAGGDRPKEGFVVPANFRQFIANEPMGTLPEFLAAIVTERGRIVHHGLRRLGLVRHEI